MKLYGQSGQRTFRPINTNPFAARLNHQFKTSFKPDHIEYHEHRAEFYISPDSQILAGDGSASGKIGQEYVTEMKQQPRIVFDLSGGLTGQPLAPSGESAAGFSRFLIAEDLDNHEDLVKSDGYLAITMVKKIGRLPPNESSYYVVDGQKMINAIKLLGENKGLIEANLTYTSKGSKKPNTVFLVNNRNEFIEIALATPTPEEVNGDRVIYEFGQVVQP